VDIVQYVIQTLNAVTPGPNQQKKLCRRLVAIFLFEGRLSSPRRRRQYTVKGKGKMNLHKKKVSCRFLCFGRRSSDVRIPTGCRQAFKYCDYKGGWRGEAFL